MASPYFRPVVLITALITMAQAIAWFVMSLLGVLAYRCDLTPSDATDNNSQFLVYLYFQGPECSLIKPSNEWLALSRVVWATPIYIHGWMCAYLTFDVTYFIISIGLLVELCRAVDGKFSLSLIRLWCLNTLTFLIMDLWLTIVFGLDFQNIQSFVNTQDASSSLGWTTSIPGALMAVTARGFILYVINFALFCYFVRASFNWSLLFTTGCCHVNQNKNGSQQQLHKSFSDPNLMYNADNIPRVQPEWDNGQVMVPVKWSSQGRRATVSYPNEEAVTSFNDWHGPRPKYYDDDLRQDSRSLGRSRPPSPQRPRPRTDDDMFPSTAGGRPSGVRSVFEYPDRRNFEQGAGRPGRPAAAHASHNDFY